jgi:hypothetical protein
MQPNPYRIHQRVLLLAVALILPAAAKSPEEFVGNTPAQSAPAPSASKVPAASPTSPAAPAATAVSDKGAAMPAKSAKPTASADSAKRTAPADSAKRPADAAKNLSAKPASAKPARAATGPAVAKPALDTARIHGLYLDGDFDQAVRSLEGALKSRKALNHADSVFIFKHLGVMYAATPATREKGRYYMLQLISIEPTARILDMYASDMIYLIFRNIQEEFEKKHGRVAIAAPVDSAAASPPAAQPEPAPLPAAAPPTSKPNRTL